MSGKPIEGNGRSHPKPRIILKTQENLKVRKISNNFGKQLKLAPNIIKMNSDNRPYVKVVIGGREVTALLDSGANISVLGQDSEDLIKENGLKTRVDASIIKTADGKKHNSVGSIDIPITYNEVTRVVKCLIVPTLVNKLLFGANFWDNFNLVPAICGITEVTENKINNTEHNLTPEQKDKLREALRLIPEAKPGKLSYQTFIKHNIDTENSKPVECRAYNYSPETEKQINEEIDRWLCLDIIEECTSPWSNPLVAVPKGLNKIRVCLDARRLNAITVKDKYPMPNVNRVFARMKKLKYFGTFDLNDAFMQTLLEDDAKEKTSFIVPGRGLFCFKRMPFGLVNSAATQCRVMQRVLGYDLEPRDFVYLDDIVITAETFDEYCSLVKIIADRLTKSGLTINIEKSD